MLQIQTLFFFFFFTVMADSPSDSCAALNLINAAVFCDCALTKTGLMDSRLLSAASSGSVKRVGLTSLRRSILKDLIPHGRKQRYVRKKRKKKTKCSYFFTLLTDFTDFFLPCFFFFFFSLTNPPCLATRRTSSDLPPPTWLTATSGPTCHSCPIPAAAAAHGCARSIFLPAIPI